MEGNSLADQPRFQNLWSLEGNDIGANNVASHHRHAGDMGAPRGHRSLCDPGTHCRAEQQLAGDPECEDDDDLMSDDGDTTVDSPRPGKKRMRMTGTNDEVTIFPRKKAGQDKLGSNRPPIIITREVLEKYFDMPQQLVCKKLGICATVIKKVCRQLGIEKWPYKGNKIDLRKRGLGPAARKDFLEDVPSTPQTSSSTCASNDDSSASERKDEGVRKAPANKKVAALCKGVNAPPASPPVKREPRTPVSPPVAPIPPPGVSANRTPKPSPRVQPTSSRRIVGELQHAAAPARMELVPHSTDIYVADGVPSSTSAHRPPASEELVKLSAPAPCALASQPAAARVPRLGCEPSAAMHEASAEEGWVSVRATAHLQRVAAAPPNPQSMAEPVMEEACVEQELLDGNEGCDLGWLVAPEPEVFGKPEGEDILSPFYRHGPHTGWG